MMQWEQLLSLRRQGDTHKRLRKEQDETRLGFEVDYDGKVSWGHRCFRATPQIWINGILATTSGELNQVASIDDIAAIEVYLGPASVPLQYGGTQGQCVMLIWTKG